MNNETLAITELLFSDEADDLTRQQTAEITTLPPECFSLVGGGEGIVVL